MWENGFPIFAVLWVMAIWYKHLSRMNLDTLDTPGIFVRKPFCILSKFLLINKKANLLCECNHIDLIIETKSCI